MITIFWNVDTQYDFMRPDGKLYVQGAETIETKLSELTEIAEKDYIKVVNTADWHTKNSKEISDNYDLIKTFPEHCMQDTKGSLFVPATDPKNPHIIDWQQTAIDEQKIIQTRNIVLRKDAFDVFTGNPFTGLVINIIKPKRIIVYGVATNVCVDFAVSGLLERKMQVYIPVDAIKELPNLPLPYETWQRKGAVLTTTNEIHKLLEEIK